MLLPILPETVDVPLDAAGYPGLVAVVRPMDVLRKAQWFAAIRDMDPIPSTAEACRMCLVTIKGVMVTDSSGTAPVPFDGQNAAHFRSLPFEMLAPIGSAILSRTTLSEAAAGN